jgi:hypothetical protein
MLSGPVFVACVFATSLCSFDAAARERLLSEDQDQADAQPRGAETRRASADTRRYRDDDRDGARVRARVDLDDRDALASDDEMDEGARRDARRRAGGGGYGRDRDEWFRDPSYYGYGNFPSVEVHDVVIANTRAATARAMFRRAENALNSAVRGAVRTFEGSQELREAQKSEKDAYAAYAAARRRALQSVLEDPKYRAIMSLRQELTDQISYARANRSVDERTDAEIRDDILAMATLKMNYAADARAMEQLALDTNAETKDAHAKLRQAGARVADLRTDFDDALRNDRDLAAARRNLEDARVARVTAATYYKGAREAALEALDFAWYLNRYERYNGAGYNDYRNYYPYVSRLTGY